MWRSVGILVDCAMLKKLGVLVWVALLLAACGGGDNGVEQGDSSSASTSTSQSSAGGTFSSSGSSQASLSSSSSASTGSASSISSTSSVSSSQASSPVPWGQLNITYDGGSMQIRPVDAGNFHSVLDRPNIRWWTSGAPSPYFGMGAFVNQKRQHFFDSASVSRDYCEAYFVILVENRPVYYFYEMDGCTNSPGDQIVDDYSASRYVFRNMKMNVSADSANPASAPGAIWLNGWLSYSVESIPYVFRNPVGLDAYLNSLEKECANLRFGAYGLDEWIRYRIASPISSIDYDFWLGETMRLYYGASTMAAYRKTFYSNPSDEAALRCMEAHLPAGQPD